MICADSLRPACNLTALILTAPTFDEVTRCR
jgi:hypothetical protein